MLLFFQKAVPATQSSVLLSVAGYTGETVEHADRPASYSTLTVIFTDPITAGTLTVQAFKNGSAVGSGVNLSSTKLRGSEGISLALADGDRVEVKATSAALAPITGDVIAIIE